MTVSESAVLRPSTNWDDYRYVRAVAETKSLVGAAEALGVNHSTVFRRINAVEEMLEYFRAYDLGIITIVQ